MQQFELSREFLEILEEAIDAGNDETIKELVAELHAADIAEIFDELDKDQNNFIFPLLDTEKSADVLIELEEDVRERLLKTLPSEDIADKLEEMDSDDAADVIGELSDETREEVLSHIDDIDQAGDIVDLLNYDEESAGGLMAKELVAVKTNWNILTCIKEIRKQAAEIDEIYKIYVVDEGNILKGILSIKKLLLIPTSDNISKHYNPDIISVRTDTPSEEVVNIMDKYDLVVLPVVDSIGRLMGRITIDDVVDVIREEAEKDYQMVSGITEDVEPFDKVWNHTRARLPWLLIGLFGGIFSAYVIKSHEASLSVFPAMFFFMPLIAAMAGNVGVQSSSIIVQGIANNTIGLESAAMKLWKELSVAFVNGIICSIVIFLYNFIFSDSFALTITVSVSLFSVILFASLFGTFVPLALNKLKIDPALATGPFITTVNDILGLVMYLYLGKFVHFLL